MLPEWDRCDVLFSCLYFIKPLKTVKSSKVPDLWITYIMFVVNLW